MSGAVHGGSSPFQAAAGGQVPEVYLNLTPLMDVMSNILFFLLASFGASAVAVYSVTVPVDASADVRPADKQPDESVTVTLRADAGGISLGCSSPARLPETLRICNQQVPKRAGQHDLVAVATALKTIKQAFPLANTVVVVPEPAMPYQQVVWLLDTTRTVRLADGRRLPLFADVILSKMVF